MAPKNPVFTVWGWMALILVGVLLASTKKTAGVVIGVLTILIVVVVLVDSRQLLPILFKAGPTTSQAG